MLNLRVGGWASVAFLALLPAGAGAVVLDDYGTYGNTFATVQATNLQTVATGTSTNGNILGGSRDVRAEVLIAKLDTWDNIYGAGTISNGWFGGYNTTLLSFGIDQAAKAAFSVVYDGAGVGAGAAGLNFDATAAGSAVRLTYMANLFIDNTTPGLDHDSNGYASTDIVMTLKDFAGQSSSVTLRMPPNVYGGFNNLDFQFSAFEAANSQLDLTNIFSIEYGAVIRNEAFTSAWLSFMGAGFSGSAYTPVNTPSGAVPEPASWAMMIGGLGIVGAAMRRRRVAFGAA